jgi:hypothetical protein
MGAARDEMLVVAAQNSPISEDLALSVSQNISFWRRKSGIFHLTLQGEQV